MDTNSPISIRAVANGFIVEPIYDNSRAYRTDAVKVYRSMNELCSDLKDHFTYRGPSVESD
jgi:hypothetical protein